MTDIHTYTHKVRADFFFWELPYPSGERSVLGPKRLIYFFMNNIFNLEGNCVLRTLKYSFSYSLSVTDIHTYIHTHIHTHKVKAD